MRRSLLVMLLLLLALPASTLYSDTTGDSARAAIEKLGSAIVWVKHTQPYEDWDGSVLTRESQTIGIFIDRQGTLVVRGHIALRDLVPYGFRVQWPDGTEAEAEYLGKDKNLNICFCRLKQPLPDAVAHFELGNTPTPAIAQKVFILTRRQQWDGSAFEVAEGRIASILPGARAACILSIPNAESFAGCPVFNEKGVFLGVIGFDLYQEEGGPAGAHPGYSLLYPGYSIAAASPVKPDSVQPGAGMGWIGAVVGSVEEKMARYLKLESGKGVYVHLVVPGSPAQVAGLLPFDIIYAIDGEPLAGEGARLASEFVNSIRKLRPEQNVALSVRRGESNVTVAVTLQEEPDDSASAPRQSFATLGLTVREMTWDFFVYRNVPDGLQGVVVDRVISGTNADLAEFALDDLIVRAGEHATPDLDSFESAIEKFLISGSKALLVEVRRGARRVYLKLEQYDEARGGK